MREIWFWQRIVSPHVAGLARALAESGDRVTYVAETAMTADRRRMGWSFPSLGPATLRYLHGPGDAQQLVDIAGEASIHVCQGFRQNGMITAAQRLLRLRGLRQWILMETVDDHGAIGWFKRLLYGHLVRDMVPVLEGVLCIGHTTSEWVAARGFPASRLFPFAYFVDNQSAQVALDARGQRFRFLFAGSLTKNKRLALLIRSLGAFSDRDFELEVIGTGELEDELHKLGNRVLPGKIRWLGVLPSARIPTAMAGSDCLVLPSWHDGWGVVVSEALMAGTSVVCSDTCGSAGVVLASGTGGVFPREDEHELVRLLMTQLDQGRRTLDERRSLSRWAAALNAQSGARYLRAILDFADGTGARPSEPWNRRLRSCAV